MPVIKAILSRNKKHQIFCCSTLLLFILVVLAIAIEPERIFIAERYIRHMVLSLTGSLGTNPIFAFFMMVYIILQMADASRQLRFTGAVLVIGYAINGIRTDFTPLFGFIYFSLILLAFCMMFPNMTVIPLYRFFYRKSYTKE